VEQKNARMIDVANHPVDGTGTDGHQPIAVAFALAHHEHLGLHVEIVAFEIAEFLTADPGGI